MCSSRGICTESLQNLHLQQGCAGNLQTGHSPRWSRFLAKHNIFWQIYLFRDSYVSVLADASADVAHCGVHTDQMATREVQIQGFQEAKLERTQFQKPARLTFVGGRVVQEKINKSKSPQSLKQEPNLKTLKPQA